MTKWEVRTAKLMKGKLRTSTFAIRTSQIGLRFERNTKQGLYFYRSRS